MANSDTVLIWLVYINFAFFLLPGIAWLVDTGIRRAFHHKPPMAWAGRRIHSHRSRFDTYRRGGGGDRVKHA